jgi:hypothetical protein
VPASVSGAAHDTPALDDKQWSDAAPRKQAREEDGRCPARTGDLLLVRREQLLRSTAACRTRRLGERCVAPRCCALLRFVASKALPGDAAARGSGALSRALSRGAAARRTITESYRAVFWPRNFDDAHAEVARTPRTPHPALHRVSHRCGVGSRVRRFADANSNHPRWTASVAGQPASLRPRRHSQHGKVTSLYATSASHR